MLDDWLAAAGDVSSAYVSRRRTDDPFMRRKIVVTEGPDDEPTYLIDTPAGSDLWIVVRCRPVPDAHEFRSLKEALNFIRPVLPASVW